MRAFPCGPAAASASERPAHPRAASGPRRADSGLRSCWPGWTDRKSTRLNSSHSQISYAVFCLEKKSIPLNSSHSQISYDLLCLNNIPGLQYSPSIVVIDELHAIIRILSIPHPSRSTDHL